MGLCGHPHALSQFLSASVPPAARRYLVREARRLGLQVIDRCNLTGALCLLGCNRRSLAVGRALALFRCRIGLPSVLLRCRPSDHPTARVLTVPAALLEPGQEDTVQFLADHQVRVVASLPCYSAGEPRLWGEDSWVGGRFWW